jgi:hypothetical protein
MVFLSPYKSSRILGRETLLAPAIKHRDRIMYFFARPWATGYFYYISDARFVIFWTTFWYFCQRVKHARSIEEDEYQRTIIRRWGGSVDSVRKQLSAADQVRVRVNLESEIMHGCFLPAWVRFKPAGLPWPEGESHHGHEGHGTEHHGHAHDAGTGHAFQETSAETKWVPAAATK